MFPRLMTVWQRLGNSPAKAKRVPLKPAEQKHIFIAAGAVTKEGAMKATLVLSTMLAAALVVSATAQTTGTATRNACLRFGEIYSWDAPDNRTLIVEDNLHQKFKVSLMGYCPNVTFRERVGFRSPGAMRLTCLLPGDDVIVNNAGAGFQRCPIRSIVAYTLAMQKTDEAAKAAKQP